MKRKLVWLSLIAVVVLGILALIPSCRLTAVGLVRGERFQAGRPTTYWLYLLRNGQTVEQKQAADALAAIGPEAVPGLVDVFEYDGQAAEYAALALKKMGPAAGPRAVGALVEVVRDDTYSSYGGEALAAMGDAGTAALLPLLDDPDPKIRARAVYRLGEIGPKAEAAVPKLIDLLRTEDREDHGFESVTGAIRNALPKIGAPAVPALTELLDSGDPVLRAWAVDALGDIGPDAKSAEPKVLAMLDEGFDFLRVMAAETLWRIDPEQVERVLPVLRLGLGKLGLFNSTSRAADALGRIGTPAVPLLLEVLKTGNTAARIDSAQALGKVGPAAPDAVPALIEALHDPSPGVRAGAAEGIKGIGPGAAAATPALIALFKEGGVQNRADVARTFQHIGPGAKDATAMLAGSLTDENEWVRRESAGALNAIGADAKEATPALEAALKKDDLRVSAAEALYKIDGRTEPVLQLLREDKHVPDALAILARIGPKPEWVVPALAEALRRDNAPGRTGTVYSVQVAKVLAGFGPDARPAAPELVAAVGEAGRNSSDGEKLTEYLAQIDPEAAAALDRPNYALYAGVGAGIVVLAGGWVWWRRQRAKRAASRAGKMAEGGPHLAEAPAPR